MENSIEIDKVKSILDQIEQLAAQGITFSATNHKDVTIFRPGNTTILKMVHETKLKSRCIQTR